MSYIARVYYPGDGVTSIYAVPFPYISQNDVDVYLNGILSLAYTWNTSSSIQFSPVPASAVEILIKRATTQVAPLHTIQVGSIAPDDINKDVTQLLYLIQEEQDETAYQASVVSDILAHFSPGTSPAIPAYISLAASVAAGLTLAQADVLAVAGGKSLVIDRNYTQGSNLILSAKEVIFMGGIITHTTFTLSFVGKVSAGDVQIFDISGTSGLVTMGSTIIPAVWFGAKPDSGTTDNKNPFLQWQLCLGNSITGTPGAKGRLIGGNGYYETSGTIQFYGSIVGDDSGIVEIRPKAGFATAFMLDFNFGTAFKELLNVTFRMDNLGTGSTVTAFGSTSSGAGGGSSLGTMNNVTIISASLGTPALQAKSSLAESGMLTGWNISIINVVGGVELGNNQDDFNIEILRHAALAGSTIDPINTAFCTNMRIGSLYSMVANLSAGGTRSCFTIGKNNRFDRIFIEGSTNADWCFKINSTEYEITIGDIETNLAMTSANPGTRGFFNLQSPAGTGRSFGLTLGNYRISAGVLPVDVLFSMFSALTTVVGPAYITMLGVGWENWNIVSAVFSWSMTGTVANANKIWRLRGYYNDVVGAWEAAQPAAGAQLTWNPIAQPATWQNR